MTAAAVADGEQGLAAPSNIFRTRPGPMPRSMSDSHLAEAGGDPAHCFFEADLIAGVRRVGIDEFVGQHTRICRAIG